MSRRKSSFCTFEYPRSPARPDWISSVAIPGQPRSTPESRTFGRVSSGPGDGVDARLPIPVRREDIFVYEHLTRPQKVRRVREALIRKEITQNGKAKLDYTDVQWLFDGHSSPGHAYDLMELAGEAEGFRYEEPGSGSNRVVVERDAVNDPALLHGANNAHDEEV